MKRLLTLCGLLLVFCCGVYGSQVITEQKTCTDITIKDKEGVVNCTGDVTIHYNENCISWVEINDPILLTFKIPEKYEGGMVIMSGNELDTLKEYIEEDNLESAKDFIENLFIITDRST